MSSKNSRNSKPSMRDLIALTLLLICLPAVVLAAVFNFNLLSFASIQEEKDLAPYKGQIGDTKYVNGFAWSGGQVINGKRSIDYKMLKVAVQMNKSSYFIDENKELPTIKAMYFDKDISGNKAEFKKVFEGLKSDKSISSTVVMPAWMKLGQKFETTIGFGQNFVEYMADKKAGYVCMWIDAEDFNTGLDAINNERLDGVSTDGDKNIVCQSFSPKVNLQSFVGDNQGKSFKNGLFINSIKSAAKGDQIDGSFAIKNSGSEPLTRDFDISFMISNTPIKDSTEFKTAYELVAEQGKKTLSIVLKSPIPAGNIMINEFLLEGDLASLLTNGKGAYLCMNIDANEWINELNETDNTDCLPLDMEWDITPYTGVIRGVRFVSGLNVARESDELIKAGYMTTAKYLPTPSFKIAGLLFNTDLSNNSKEFKIAYELTPEKFKSIKEVDLSSWKSISQKYFNQGLVNVGPVVDEKLVQDLGKAYKCIYIDYEDNVREIAKSEGDANVSCALITALNAPVAN